MKNKELPTKEREKLYDFSTLVIEKGIPLPDKFDPEPEPEPKTKPKSKTFDERLMEMNETDSFLFDDPLVYDNAKTRVEKATANGEKRKYSRKTILKDGDNHVIRVWRVMNGTILKHKV